MQAIVSYLVAEDEGMSRSGRERVSSEMVLDLNFCLSLWWLLHYLKELEYLNLVSNKRLTGQVCVCVCVRVSNALGVRVNLILFSVSSNLPGTLRLSFSTIALRYDDMISSL